MTRKTVFTMNNYLYFSTNDARIEKAKELLNSVFNCYTVEKPIKSGKSFFEI